MRQDIGNTIQGKCIIPFNERNINLVKYTMYEDAHCCMYEDAQCCGGWIQEAFQKWKRQICRFLCEFVDKTEEGGEADWDFQRG